MDSFRGTQAEAEAAWRQTQHGGGGRYKVEAVAEAAWRQRQRGGGGRGKVEAVTDAVWRRWQRQRGGRQRQAQAVDVPGAPQMPPGPEITLLTAGLLALGRLLLAALCAVHWERCS